MQNDFWFVQLTNRFLRPIFHLSLRWRNTSAVDSETFAELRALAGSRHLFLEHILSRSPREWLHNARSCRWSPVLQVGCTVPLDRCLTSWERQQKHCHIRKYRRALLLAWGELLLSALLLLLRYKPWGIKSWSRADMAYVWIAWGICRNRQWAKRLWRSVWPKAARRKI